MVRKDTPRCGAEGCAVLRGWLPWHNLAKQHDRGSASEHQPRYVGESEWGSLPCDHETKLLIGKAELKKFTTPDSRMQVLPLVTLPWGHSGGNVFSKTFYKAQKAQVYLHAPCYFLPFNLERLHLVPWGTTAVSGAAISRKLMRKSILWHMHDHCVTNTMSRHQVVFMCGIHHRQHLSAINHRAQLRINSAKCLDT